MKPSNLYHAGPFLTYLKEVKTDAKALLSTIGSQILLLNHVESWLFIQVFPSPNFIWFCCLNVCGLGYIAAGSASIGSDRYLTFRARCVGSTTKAFSE